ncbi:MAG: sodium:calcium antiporter [Elusimicrobiota bacterium]
MTASLSDGPLALAFAVFAAAALAVWAAGVKLERYADGLAEATGLGQGMAGLLLLAGATSLPEIATVGSAVWIGRPEMAAHNLLGSVIMNAAILAAVDLAEGRGAISHFTPRFSLLVQGTGLMALLAAALMAMTGAEFMTLSWRTAGSPFHVNLGLAALFAGYLLVAFLSWRAEENPRWRAAAPAAGREAAQARPPGRRRGSAARPALLFSAAALAVLAAGWILSNTADVLARRTGLGEGFVGVTLLALSTSLPELSTTLSAVRRRRNAAAISNIFGSSALAVALLFPLALLAAAAGGEPLFVRSMPSAVFAAALGILLTGVSLWGLLERRDASALRLGADSWVVLGLAAGGFWVLYQLK